MLSCCILDFGAIMEFLLQVAGVHSTNTNRDRLTFFPTPTPPPRISVSMKGNKQECVLRFGGRGHLVCVSRREKALLWCNLLVVSLGKWNCNTWLSPSLSINDSPERNLSFFLPLLLSFNFSILYICCQDRFGACTRTYAAPHFSLPDGFSPLLFQLFICTGLLMLLRQRFFSISILQFPCHYLRRRVKRRHAYSEQTKGVGVFRLAPHVKWSCWWSWTACSAASVRCWLDGGHLEVFHFT